MGHPQQVNQMHSVLKQVHLFGGTDAVDKGRETVAYDTLPLNFMKM